LPGSLFYALAGRIAASGRSSLFELAFWQLVNSSHKAGEAVRHWLLGIAPSRSCRPMSASVCARQAVFLRDNDETLPRMVFA